MREGLDTGVAEQPVGQISEGAELALSFYPGISSLLPQRGRIFAGTNGLHTPFFDAKRIQLEAFELRLVNVRL